MRDIHTVSYIFASEDTTGYTPWDRKLASLLDQARRRVSILHLVDARYVVDDTMRVTCASGPVKTIGARPPKPRIPVVWPRGTTIDASYSHIDELVVMGEAAIMRDLDVYASGARSERDMFRQLGGIVTALRVGVAACMSVQPVNVDKPSKYTVEYDGEHMRLLSVGSDATEHMQLRLHRTLRKIALEGAGTTLPSFSSAALLGPFLMLIASLKRGMGPQAAMASMYTKLFDTAMLKSLPVSYHKTYGAEWVRSAIIEETWRAFPDDVGDLIQSDYVAQETACRAALADEDELAASVARVNDHIRIRSMPTSRKTVRQHVVVQRVPVPEDELSICGDFEDDHMSATTAPTPYIPAARTPETSYTPLAPRPMVMPQSVYQSGMHTPVSAYMPPVMSPENVAEFRNLMTESYARQVGEQESISPRAPGVPLPGTPPIGGI